VTKDPLSEERLRKTLANVVKPPNSKPPPGTPRQDFAVMVRAPRVGHLHFLVTAAVGVGCWLHWSDARKRSYPCVGVDCDCGASEQRRWYGWLPAKTHSGGLRSLVEITPPVREALADLNDPDRGLAGLSLSLERRQDSRGHALTLAVHRRLPLAALPPTFDPIPELLRLWGLDGPDERRVPCWDWPLPEPAAETAVPWVPRLLALCPACGAAGVEEQGSKLSNRAYCCPSCETRWLESDKTGGHCAG
jgi:hypothetical protein